ncbi:hypothetical protein ACFL2X_02915 [Candidatus Latescibacterota bacterium]
MSKTVYVVGAGASKEANLPIGSELKGDIAKLLDFKTTGFFVSELESGDPVIWDALKIHIKGKDRNAYRIAANQIRDAMPLASSIDNFIDSHRDDKKIELCGKLAIVRSILHAEKKSLLYFEKSNVFNSINFDSLVNTWYLSFFRLITENCNTDDLEARFKSITLIIFNYDRCIEHFIYCALKKYYPLSDVEAANLVKEITIFHPYGIVGTLPWIDNNGAIDFGADPAAPNLLELSMKIKTFTESTDAGSSEIVEIRKKMNLVSRLVFLGFAFHELNMQLITPEHVDAKTREINCFATTNNMSESNKTFIEGQINNLYHANYIVYTKMSNSTCGQFFSEFWKSLAF